LEQSQEVASVFHEVDKSRSVEGGYLAGNNPRLLDEAFVAWLLVNQVGLSEDDVDRLMDLFR
jgi:hypothetical protein